jgi:hypothetical protein
MAGNKDRLETLYKAMAGVEKIPDELAGNKDKLAEEIAQMYEAS